MLRGQLGHARRTSTSEAGYIAQVGATTQDNTRADVRTHVGLHGSDTALCPPSLRRWTAEVSSIARRSSTSELGYITRGGVGQVGTRARTSASTHARGWCGGSPFLPGAPCAMRARSGRGRHARGRQERRAPTSRTPPRSRTSRFYRALCADDGPWRTRALLRQPPSRSAIPADPVGRRASSVRFDRPQKLVTLVANFLDPPL